MTLEKVFLSSDVYFSCVQLSLSTENEEVICLLLGETKEVDKKEHAYIYAIKIPQRMDIKKDRVEISVDQLIAAQEYAEELTQRCSREIRVLGWFHSHPHITVWPSHIDVNTQANYQAMSSSFVGLICSVFSEEKTTKNLDVNITCYQSERTTNDNGIICNLRKPITCYVVHNSPISSNYNCLEAICDLPSILYQEEEESYIQCVDESEDVLSSVHNETLLTKSLLHITNKISIPLLRSLETRKKILKSQDRNMKKFSDTLRSAFGGLSETTQMNIE